MATFKVGVQLRPHHADIRNLRRAWHALDDLGVHAVFMCDHFFPHQGDPDGSNFECWTLLAAMAAETRQIRIGSLVSCSAFRNPDLLADMARTVDQLSGSRLILGMGAGWFERDFTEYGYDFGTAYQRLQVLRSAVLRIRDRLPRLNPPAAHIPLLIGGGGERVTLRIAAEHADLWNSVGPPGQFRHQNDALDRWCARVGRDPTTIQRTVLIQPSEVDDYQAFLDAGAEHILVMISTAAGEAFDPAPARRLLRHAN